MIAWRSPRDAEIDAADDLGPAEALAHVASVRGRARHASSARARCSPASISPWHVAPVLREAPPVAQNSDGDAAADERRSAQASRPARAASSANAEQAHDSVPCADVQRARGTSSRSSARAADAAPARRTSDRDRRRAAAATCRTAARAGSSGSGSAMPPGAYITMQHEEHAEVELPGLRELRQRDRSEHEQRPRRGSGRRRTPTPPMKVSSSTPPERSALTFSARDDLEVDRAPARRRCRRRSPTG